MTYSDFSFSFKTILTNICSMFAYFYLCALGKSHKMRNITYLTISRSKGSRKKSFEKLSRNILYFLNVK